MDQTIETTRERVLRGDCHVAVYEGHIVGTMTLHASEGEASREKKSRVEAPDASATIAICCGKYCNGDSSRANVNAAPTQRGRFASGEGEFTERCMQPSASDHAHQQGDEEDHQEDEEQHLGDFGCARGNASKAEHCGDDGDDEENHSVSKHGASTGGLLK
ncbi:hypothetical protein OKW46_002275 [Paraburkholderia sp. WSM4179]|nr:hypothetical protein [Paraburkholderia sp. WSM4179]